MYNLYRVSNLAVWLQQINQLYLLRYLLTTREHGPRRWLCTQHSSPWATLTKSIARLSGVIQLPSLIKPDSLKIKHYDGKMRKSFLVLRGSGLGALSYPVYATAAPLSQ